MTDDLATILLVDDDADTRSSIRRVLEKQGYHVLEAEGPAQASGIANGKGEEIDGVVLDVIMPGMSGISVADELAPEFDDLRILYISGFIDGELLSSSTMRTASTPPRSSAEHRKRSSRGRTP